MSSVNLFKLSKYKQLLAIITINIFIFWNVNTSNAQTAGDVMNKMNDDQSIGYITGVIEGLAYSRWLRDKPNGGGSKCIYDWYYKGGEKVKRQMFDWFDRHPDKGLGPLLYVLIKKECGE